MDIFKEYKRKIDNFSLVDKQGSRFPENLNEHLKNHQILKKVMLQKQSMEQKQEPEKLTEVNFIEDVKKYFQNKE